nr:hypothetical protein [uncultured archaeon]
MKSKEVKNIDFWERLLSELPESYKEWFKEERKFLHDI